MPRGREKNVRDRQNGGGDEPTPAKEIGALEDKKGSEGGTNGKKGGG